MELTYRGEVLYASPIVSTLSLLSDEMEIAVFSAV
jgi:hypothetical protein